MPRRSRPPIPLEPPPPLALQAVVRIRDGSNKYGLYVRDELPAETERACNELPATLPKTSDSEFHIERNPGLQHLASSRITGSASQKAGRCNTVSSVKPVAGQTPLI